MLQMRRRQGQQSPVSATFPRICDTRGVSRLPPVGDMAVIFALSTGQYSNRDRASRSSAFAGPVILAMIPGSRPQQERLA